MQKKKDDIPALRLLVVMTFKAVVEPKKYAPPSPRKILPKGKFNINIPRIEKNNATKNKLFEGIK